MKYVYSFNVLMGYNGKKGLTEKPFKANDVVHGAKTEQEAIEMLDKQNDELGYKVLNVLSMKIETTKEHKTRIDREFDEYFNKEA